MLLAIKIYKGNFEKLTCHNQYLFMTKLWTPGVHPSHFLPLALRIRLLPSPEPPQVVETFVNMVVGCLYPVK